MRTNLTSIFSVFFSIFLFWGGYTFIISEIKPHQSSEQVVRIAQNSILKTLTKEELIQITNLNGVQIHSFDDVQKILRTINKSNSVNIDYQSINNPVSSVSIATPSLIPNAIEDFYSNSDLGIFPGQAVVFCLKKNSILSDLNVKVNDVIILLNNKPFAEAIKNEVLEFSEQKKIKISVIRNGEIVNLEKILTENVDKVSSNSLGYLPPSISYYFDSFPMLHFGSDSVTMRMKGYTCNAD